MTRSVKLKRAVLFISVTIGTFSCRDQAGQQYIVQRTGETVVVDGMLTPGEWEAEAKLRDFSFPWLKEKAPLTEFRASTDGKNFYFAFRAEDDKLVISPYEKEIDVASGDRVEIFFTKDKALKEYYCLEIDPRGNVLDYKAAYYRKFDDSWNCPQLTVAAGISPGGYIVEASIPLEVLEKLGVYSEGRPILAGLYRAECVSDSASEDAIKWISWVDPATPEPDFHVPSSFGYLHVRAALALPVYSKILYGPFFAK